MRDTVDSFRQALLEFDQPEAARLLDGMCGGWQERIEAVVVPALEHIGAEWEAGSVSLSQVYMSGRICEELIDALLPTAIPQRRTSPRIGLAVLEDYHLLGKRLVYSVLRASGHEVLDYGQVQAGELIHRAATDRLEILMISVLMLNSALKVAQVCAGLARLPRRPLVVVGGAPFRLDAELWREVGADAMGRTAASSVELVHRLGGQP